MHVKHWLKGFIMSAGVNNHAQKYGAFWLIDAILSHYPKANRLCDGFQFWTLQVADSKAVIYCTDGNSKTRRVTQDFTYTDHPEGEWRFWVADKTIFLPEEY